MRNPIAPSTVVVVGLLALIAGYAIGATIAVKRQQRSREGQPVIVTKALNPYGHGNTSGTALLAAYEPTVVYLPTMTCVAMKPRRPFAGGEDTMCFDKGGKRLLFSYTSGD